jgi:hypothetical protein
MSTRGDEKSAGVTSGTPIKSLAEKSHSAPTIVGESMNIQKIANHSTNTAISTTEATERSTSGRAASSASSSAVAASSSVVSAFPLDATVKSWKEVWAELKKLGWTCKNGKGLMVDYFYIKPGRKLKGGVLGDDYFIGHEDVMQYYHKGGAAVAAAVAADIAAEIAAAAALTGVADNSADIKSQAAEEQSLNEAASADSEPSEADGCIPADILLPAAEAVEAVSV